jgi:hypothetical protein
MKAAEPAAAERHGAVGADSQAHRHRDTGQQPTTEVRPI